MVCSIENMLTDRSWRDFIDNLSSKITNEGLPQGSIFAFIIFNLYSYDTPHNSFGKFIYADDIPLVFHHSDFEIIETTLST